MKKQSPDPSKKKTKKVKVLRQNKVSFYKNHWIPALLFLVGGLALYLPSLQFDYVLDDKIVITENAFVKKGLKGLKEIFTTDSFQGYFGEQKNLVQGARYRPLSIASFAIEHQFFGLNKKVSHFFNALLYGLLCFVIYRTLVLLFNANIKTKWFFSLAFISTLLYTFHPVHIEAVANIKGRDEILSMLFSMLALLAALKFYDNKKWWYLVLSPLYFFLGILAKENAITFLAVIPVSLYFFRKTNWKLIGTSLLPLLIITGVYLALRIDVIGFLFDNSEPIKEIMNDPFYRMKSDEKFATIIYTLGQYLKLSFFPIQLTHDYYPYHIPIMNWGKPGSIISLLLYLGIGVGTLIGMAKKQVWSYGLFFYIATLSIASNLVFSIGTFMNERFLFMPSLGICILLSWLLMKFLSPRLGNNGKWIGFGTALLIAGLFLTKDLLRMPAWKDTMSLNRAAIKVSKNSARANLFLGVALFEEYKKEPMAIKKLELLNEAEPLFDKAIEIYPQYGQANQMKSGALAERYKSDKNLDKLLTGFKEIIKRRPVAFIDQYLEYLNGKTNETDKLVNFYNDVGYNILGRSGDIVSDPQDKKRFYGLAVKYLTWGLELDPSNQILQQNLNRIYSKQ
ncbi:MAG: hypothetical protein AAGK97_02260 [Bacteroidota bacterium]